MKKALVLSYPLSAQRKLLSDWADAQADLSLRWAHTHFVGFADSVCPKFLYFSRCLIVYDAICPNDGCMMLFVADTDFICAKAVKMVGFIFVVPFLTVLL